MVKILKRYTKDKILNDTMVGSFNQLKDQMTSRKLMETRTVAFEFKEKLIIRPLESSSQLDRIERQLKNYENDHV